MRWVYCTESRSQQYKEQIYLTIVLRVLTGPWNLFFTFSRLKLCIITNKGREAERNVPPCGESVSSTDYQQTSLRVPAGGVASHCSLTSTAGTGWLLYHCRIKGVTGVTGPWGIFIQNLRGFSNDFLMICSETYWRSDGGRKGGGRGGGTKSCSFTCH